MDYEEKYTITEDYVSFETAKLLKEKGFECEKDSITAMYNELGKFHPLSTAVDEYYYDYNDFDEYDYVAPTLQMAMKWLREVHYYNIEIDTLGMMELNTLSWRSAVYYLVNENECYCEDGFDSYEQAAEAAIKYCLENLI